MTHHDTQTQTQTQTQTSQIIQAVIAGKRARFRRRVIVATVMGFAAVVLFVCTLMIGERFTSFSEVIRILTGEDVPAASFLVRELRLPRATAALLTGCAFGIAGVVFQSLLRNPLASPDVIGISAGSGAFAVIGITVLGLSDTAVSFLALAGAVLTAGAIYLLSRRGGFAGVRFILIGIGMAAMLTSVTSYLVSRSSNWEIQAAMQWLAGSLNSTGWAQIAALAVAIVILVPVILVAAHDAGPLRLGDSLATTLGTRIQLSRLLLMLGAVTLLAFATAATGPIAFVAFMAGPIATRLSGYGGGIPMITAGLTGSVLVLGADLAGQFLFEQRYPVGIITGVLGAPFLLALLIRMNRSGNQI